MKKFTVILVLLLTMISKVSWSQTDTEFWFVAPEVTYGHNFPGGIPAVIRLATLDLPSQVIVTMPANAYNPVTNPNGFVPDTVNIPANSAANVDVSKYIRTIGVTGEPGEVNQLENKPLTPSGINGFGIHITASTRITAYYEISNIYNNDIWALKGRNALGTEFFTPFQTHGNNGSYTPKPYSAIDIVATEDNTIVTLTPTKDASYGSLQTLAPAGVPLTITLQRGQTFSLYPKNASQDKANRLSGTRIVSNKSIAVSIKDDSIDHSSGSCKDIIGDQLVPTNIIGTDYIVIKSHLNDNDHIYVLATQNATNIYLDGVYKTTLNAGQQYYYMQTATNPIVHVSTSNDPAILGKPIYVMHVGGFGCEQGAAILPPINICTGSTQVAFTRSNSNNFYLNLMVRNGAEDGFLLDGAPTALINPVAFTPIAGTSWSAIRLGPFTTAQIPVAQHLLSNSKDIFHLGIVNGGGSIGCMYGYFSDYNEVEVAGLIAGTNSPIIKACYGSPVQLVASGGTNYTWNPSTFLDNPYISTPVAMPTHTIKYTVTVSGACNMTDSASVTVLVSNPVQAIFTTDKVDGCAPVDVTINNHSIGITNYSWRYGDGQTSTTNASSQVHTYTNTGTTPLSRTLMLVGRNPYACRDTMKTVITVRPEIEAIASANIISGCAPLQVDFSNASIGANAFLWEFGDGSSSTEEAPVYTFHNLTDQPINYTVKLHARSEYNCEHSDSLVITVLPSVKANFGFDPSEVCHPYNANIINNSYGAGNFIWNFGDGSPISNTQDSLIPHLYENYGNTPETFTVGLIIESPYGCHDTLYKDLTVFPYIKSDFTADVIEGCNPLQVEFSDLSVGASSYLWDFDSDQGTSSLPGPVFTFENPDTKNIREFNVTLLVSNEWGCTDQKELQVSVYPRINAEFAFDSSAHCSPYNLEIFNQSEGVTNYSWDFGDGSFSNDTTNLLYHTYNNTTDIPQNYTIGLIATNDFGCTDTMEQDLVVYPQVVASFEVQTSGCHPLEVEFENTSSNAGQYLWNFGDGSATSDLNPSHIYYNNSVSQDTSFTAILSVASEFGCYSTFSRDIRVFPKPKSHFEVENSPGCAPLPVDFLNLSQGALVSNWFYGDGSSANDSNMLSNQHVYNNDGESSLDYEVSLVVLNYYECADTSSRVVTVFPEIHASFDLNVVEGCNPLEVELQNFSHGASAALPYNWSYGDGEESTSLDIIHGHTFNNFSHTEVKEFEITLNAFSSFGCKSEITKTVQVFPVPDAVFNTSIEEACSPAEAQYANLSLGADSFTWTFGDGGSANSVQATHIFNNPANNPPAQYQTKLIASNQYGCQDSLVKNITIFPDIEAAFEMNASGCHPLDVNFVNLSQGAQSYSWSLGDGNFTNEPEPLNTYVNNSFTDIKTYQVSLQTSSVYGCSDQISKTIEVYPVPQTSFTTELSEGCSPLNIPITNQSVGVTQYDWNFGNGNSTNSFQYYTHQYSNLEDNPLSFVINLNGSNQYGCSSQISKTINVYPEVSADFSTDDNIFKGCTPFTPNFVNLSQRASIHTWDFGTGTTSTNTNPSHMFITLPAIDSVYTVSLLSKSVYGCSDTIFKQVTVYPQPSADFHATPYVQTYPETTITLNNQSIPGNWTYSWNMGDGTQYETQSNQPVSHTYNWPENDYATQIYTVNLNVSNGYCSDTISQKVTIKAPFPLVGFLPADEGCPPFDVQFVNNSIYGKEYHWDFGDGKTSQEKDPQHVFTDPGVYNVKLLVVAEGGVDSAYQQIIVHSPPVVDFRLESESVQLPFEPIKTINLSSLGSYYEWHFGDGTMSYEKEPVHYYQTNGTYDITLIVGSDTEPMCYAQKTIQGAAIAEEPCRMIFPNAFIPDQNGPSGGRYVPNDPSNTIFFPIHEGVSEYRLEIYNRWGERIFVSEDVSIGWDGYFKGKLCPMDVYVWKVWATCYGGGKIKQMGDVTLYR